MEALYCHFLLTCPRLSLIDRWKLFSFFRSFQLVFKNVCSATLAQLGFSSQKQRVLLAHKKAARFQKSFDALSGSNICLLPISDKRYPPVLRHIAKQPLGIYVRGDPAFFTRKRALFAIVGPRKQSLYCERVTKLFASVLAREGYTIVSGLAKGADATAHRATLDPHGTTIAVLGSPIDSIYPSAHTDLARRIIESGGVIISEYPPGTKTERSHFVARNRIISGLCEGIFVAEAPRTSGSIITAQFGFEQNRRVYTCPQQIFEKQGIGTNWLIYKSIAQPVFTPYDILSDLQPEMRYTDRERRHYIEHIDRPHKVLTPEQQTLFALTRSSGTTPETYMQQSGFTLQKVLGILSELEIQRLITNRGIDGYAVL